MGYLSSSERTLRNLASFLLVFSFIAAVNSVIDIYYRKDDSQDIHNILIINTILTPRLSEGTLEWKRL